MIEIALYQPDIAANTATILRLAACLGLPVHIIEPAGFAWGMRSFKRAGMDYVDEVVLHRHDHWPAFQDATVQKRLILATTKAKTAYTDVSYERNDILVFGRESAGVPNEVHQAADISITIPMRKGLRSINVAMSVAMIAGEAIRQVDGFAGPEMK